ncbi:hemophore-related protein [Nocardia sp. NPDC004068]|uniref:hemophore-related protein n=1 Tax=Nocardia sp. NPDC004068 TaxID=3364303 RepID=UPI0036A743D0
MISSRARFTRTALALGGFAAATTLLAGTAAADSLDIMEPVLTSSCSFDQVDRAMHDDPVASMLAEELDKTPGKREELKAILDTPLDQRQEKIAAHRAEVEQRIQSDPEAARVANDPRLAELRGVFEKVAEDCKTK